MRDFQQPKFLASSSKFKRGINFLQGAKVELDVHHYSFTLFIASFPSTITQPIYLGSHTCTSWFDCMARLVPLDPCVWLCNKCLQVWIPCLPTYELHISQLEVGWEREGIMLLCLMPQIPHILREERRHTP
jgi:hypothetical protein